jgi:DNA-binding HxlR family transcriptional regulator
MCPVVTNESTIRNGCVAAAATIIGAKWTPQILYALCQGTTHFCELQDAVGGINPRTLSARLAELETMEILTKSTPDRLSSRAEYTLTTKGEDLIPILESMIVWGEKHPPSDHMHVEQC